MTLRWRQIRFCCNLTLLNLSYSFIVSVECATSRQKGYEDKWPVVAQQHISTLLSFTNQRVIKLELGVPINDSKKHNYGTNYQSSLAGREEENGNFQPASVLSVLFIPVPFTREQLSKVWREPELIWDRIASCSVARRWRKIELTSLDGLSVLHNCHSILVLYWVKRWKRAVVIKVMRFRSKGTPKIMCVADKRSEGGGERWP